MRCDRFDSPTKSRHSCATSISAAADYDYTAPKSYGFRELELSSNNWDCFEEAHGFDERVLLSVLSDYVQDSPLAHSLVSFIKGTGWKVSLDDLGSNGFHMDADEKEITLDHFNMSPRALNLSSHFKMALVYIFIKALRDMWHEENWDDMKQEYCPKSLLQLERARTADGDSMAILIAWELRAAGKEDLWRYVLSSDESDMAHVLTNILDRYPTALYNGMALAHVFRQWYADENRINAQDHMTLEYFDMMMARGDTIFGDRIVTADIFEKLTYLSDGTSYLNQLGDTVLKDPFFADLDDPVNQAHLSQIIYDHKITMVKGIPFRDAALARRFMD